jgi:hypothetical protein
VLRTIIEPFEDRRREEELMAQAGGVLRLLYHLKFRDADTSFKLDNS